MRAACCMVTGNANRPCHDGKRRRMAYALTGTKRTIKGRKGTGIAPKGKGMCGNGRRKSAAEDDGLHGKRGGNSGIRRRRTRDDEGENADDATPGNGTLRKERKPEGGRNTARSGAQNNMKDMRQQVADPAI